MSAQGFAFAILPVCVALFGIALAQGGVWLINLADWRRGHE